MGYLKALRRSAAATAIAAAACLVLALPTALSNAAATAALGGGGEQENVEVKIVSRASGTTPIPVAVVAGSEFTITLASNRTTGYQWRLANTPSAGVVQLVGSTYNEPSKPIPGKGGSESWAFRAVGKGSATILLEYVRPWEKDASPAKTQTFEVKVM